MNVSVEKKEDQDGKLGGYIRIRSKTQGIALSLGDRITAVQRASANTSNNNSGEKPSQQPTSSATAAATEGEDLP